MAECGQEAGLGQRCLLGKFLLVPRQLPFVATAQTTPVQPRAPQQQGHAQEDEDHQAARTAPPRRLHAETQQPRARPDVVRRRRLHFQLITPRPQSREHPLAARADFHPVGVIASQSEAVGIGRRVGKGQQPRDDAQIAVAFLDQQHRFVREVLLAVATAHAHPLDHQRRLPR
ncbi:hypothetical protein D3C81_1219350 [compost metagenome]